MRFLARFLLLVLYTAVSAAQQVPKNIQGTYVMKQASRDYSVDCSASYKPDCGIFIDTSDVRIERLPDGAIRASVNAKGDNGHSCYMEGGATWDRGRLTMRQAVESPYGGACVLELVFTGANALDVQDVSEGLVCNALCGVRAGFSGGPYRRLKPVSANKSIATGSPSATDHLRR
jgi:hypothetical protein